MKNILPIPEEIVINKIYNIRDYKVILDDDLAKLYDVETRALNQQVKRNRDRFPEDFMFILSKSEWESIKKEDTTGKWGGRRNPPNAFTEHGVLMLSSVINNKKAIAVNIQIMRIFTKLREMVLSHKDLIVELESLKKRMSYQDNTIEKIYNYLIQFVNQNKDIKKNKIGFKRSNK